MRHKTEGSRSDKTPETRVGTSYVTLSVESSLILRETKTVFPKEGHIFIT